MLFENIFMKVFPAGSVSVFTGFVSALVAGIQKFWIVYMILGFVFLSLVLSKSQATRAFLAILTFPVCLSGGVFSNAKLLLALFLEIMMFKLFDTEAFFVFFAILLVSWIYRFSFTLLVDKFKKG